MKPKKHTKEETEELSIRDFHRVKRLKDVFLYLSVAMILLAAFDLALFLYTYKLIYFIGVFIFAIVGGINAAISVKLYRILVRNQKKD